MAGKSRQPSHEPAHVEREKTGTRHPDKTVERKEEGQGRGDSLQGVLTLRRNPNARKTVTKTPSKRYNALAQEHEESCGTYTYIPTADRAGQTCAPSC